MKKSTETEAGIAHKYNSVYFVKHLNVKVNILYLSSFIVSIQIRDVLNINFQFDELKVTITYSPDLFLDI